MELEMNKLVDITRETECLKEIKDILDELNSISSVFKQQVKIVSIIMDEDRRCKKTSHTHLSDEGSSSTTCYIGSCIGRSKYVGVNL
jgi:uncharacterized protein (DUF2344 family)